MLCRVCSQKFRNRDTHIENNSRWSDFNFPDLFPCSNSTLTLYWDPFKFLLFFFFITETSTLSPLSWLMNEYLENAESSKRCKSSASIFNSRVRRLTHLLVHVDTSTVDTEELKPPIKSSEWLQNYNSSF